MMDDDGTKNEPGDTGAKPDTTAQTQAEEQRKALEAEIEGLAAELAEDLPEQFRSLIPDLPPTQKVKWLRQAIKSGAFSKSQEDGPGAKRPASKRGEDLNGLSPHQMLAMGYGK
jgi:uncharacterized protein YhaN